MSLIDPGKPKDLPVSSSVLPDFLFLKTSSKILNESLGGGFLRGSVHGIYGIWGTGKSQICQDLAKNVAIQGGTIGVIDADAANGWNIIAKVNILFALGEKLPSPDELITQGILKGTDYVTLTQQYREFLDKLLNKHGITIYNAGSIEEMDKIVENITSALVYDLLIVDSLTLFYKDDMCVNRGERRVMGGEYLPVLARITVNLDKYAKNGATIICTMQRKSEIGLEKAKKLTPGEEYREHVGTDVPAYKFDTLIELRKEGSSFKAYLHKKRGLPADPKKGVPFNAVPGGIA